jgi:hypothetical protein
LCPFRPLFWATIAEVTATAPTIMTQRTSLLVLLLAVPLASVALPARAQCPRAAVRTLVDGTGQSWDFNQAGMVVRGTDGAFSGLNQLTVDGVLFDPRVDPVAEGTRGFGFLQTGATFSVLRHVYVPATGTGYVRYIEEIRNNTAAPRELDIIIRTNVGYDDMSMEVVSTTDDDLTLEATDRYFVIDDEFEQLVMPDGPFVEQPPNAYCEALWGMNGFLQPMAVSGGAGFGCGGMLGNDMDGTTVRWRLNIGGMMSARIMYFVSQHATRAGAVSACPMIATLSPDRYEDLSIEERATVANWDIRPPMGSPCSSDAMCTTGQCSDGICCNEDCGGGSMTDCLACTRMAGGTVDGVCTTIPAMGYNCRRSGGSCDPPELCDGVSAACPADRLNPAGEVCRPGNGGCDLAEQCTGTNPACPNDRVAFAGTICSPGIGGCEPPARCDGTTTLCPTPMTFPDGTPCDDLVPCTYATCNSGACTPLSGTCDDRDMCTTDSCAASMSCVNTFMPGCVGGRDGGPDASMVFLDAAGSFDAGDPFTDAPNPDFDGGEFFDAAGLDASGRMDSSVPRDANDGLTVTGGGCSCRAGAVDGGAPLLLCSGGLLGLWLLGRRSRR